MKKRILCLLLVVLSVSLIIILSIVLLSTPKSTSQPTIRPTSQPTLQPTSKATLQPTLQPTSQATLQPTLQPTNTPEEDKPLSGWQQVDGKTCYIDPETGLVHTGWLYLDEGTWFLKEDGEPYTGWMHTDEARYYFLEDGTMAIGSFYIDGVFRYFSSDGNYVPLINPWNEVPEDYTPRLVSIEGEKMDSSCVEALKKLMADARKAGLTCELNSGYRSISTQTYLWNRRYNDYISKGYSEEEAYRLTARRVAYPGTSEHHTGLAIDIVELVEDGTLYEWFRQHAWEYGFVVRYRGDKEPLTGIKDEPWHLRYVGKEVAQILQENDWCLEEFMNQFAG